MKASLEVAQRSEIEIFDVCSIFNICPCMVLFISFWKWWRHSAFPVGVGTAETVKEVNFPDDAMEVVSPMPIWNFI